MNNQHIPLNPKSLRTKFTLHFLKALKKINQTHNNQPNDSNNNGNNNHLIIAKKCKKIKKAANASLATAVGPRRAWTRAILMRAGYGPQRGRRRRALGRRVVVRRKVRPRRPNTSDMGRVIGPTEELRRVVPGGEAMDMQSLLDETLHYAMCLTTQVKVMRSIVDLCTTTTA